MLVRCRMTPAFLGAGTAESDAGGQLRFQRLTISCLVGARNDAAGGGADGGAIQIEPDAGNHALDVFFRQAGVRAGRASLDADGTSVDTGADRLGMGGMIWM
jgi:hypothetical protein